MIQLFMVLTFLISLIMARILIPSISLISVKKRLFDIPNDRTTHKGSIPRLGGLSFYPTILFTMSLVMVMRLLFGDPILEVHILPLVKQLLLLVCGLTLLYFVGIADDLVGVMYRKKFIVQFICACLLPISGIYINHFYGLFGVEVVPEYIGIPLTIFLCVFITNAINLIDGIDGLASSLSGVAFTMFAFLFYAQGLYAYSMLSMSALGVLAPFFYYNVWGRTEKSTKIFMGDTGSLTLGYVLSFLCLKYAMSIPEVVGFTSGAILISFVSLLVPCFDVIRVVLVRLRTGNHAFKPDRNHIHHKFLAMGVSHRRTMFLILLISCGFCVSNLLLFPYVDINILFVADIAVWVVLNLWFDYMRDKYQKGLNKSNDINNDSNK